MRGATVQVKCKVCKREFTARVADRKRGWARCCSKSCAAILSNKKTGKWDKYRFGKRVEHIADVMMPYEFEDHNKGDD